MCGSAAQTAKKPHETRARSRKRALERLTQDPDWRSKQDQRPDPTINTASPYRETVQPHPAGNTASGRRRGTPSDSREREDPGVHAPGAGNTKKAPPLRPERDNQASGERSGRASVASLKTGQTPYLELVQRRRGVSLREYFQRRRSTFAMTLMLEVTIHEP